MIRSYIDVLRASLIAGILAGGIQIASGADVTSYSVRKGQVLSQSSAAAPVADPFSPAIFIARADVDTDAINSVVLSSPSQFFAQVPLDLTGDHYEFVIPGTEADLNSFFPNGNYAFTFNGGATVGPITLSSGVFPTPTPQILNYDAAQEITPGSSFTLNFTPYTGAGAGDSFQFEILDSDRSILYSATGTTGTSVTIPAGTLSADQSYDARLRFVHNVESNTTSIPGATGSAGYFKENQFSVSTAGSGGGGGNDTTPPALVFTTPANGATAQAVSTPVVFIFSEPMARQQSVQWSPNLDPTKFNYSWGVGDSMLNATYAGGFPANATITWTLAGGASGFKDVAGNALLPGAQGSFATGTSGGGGGTTNNPCISTNQPNSDAGFGSVFKQAQYVQSGNNAPTPEPENPAAAFASYRAAKNQNVTSVNITGPNNINITLQNTFGSYFAFQEFPSAAALDTAFPAGAYTITATGGGSGTLNLPNISSVTVPRINNLAEFGAFDPTRDFTLNFVPFAGAGQSDSIMITIEGQNGEHFYAPDYCLNRLLPNTATSVVIPANTFKTAGKLSGMITFSTFSVNTNAIPDTMLSAAGSVSTEFNATIGGGGGSDVRWTTIVQNPNGTITFTIAAPAGTTLRVQKSPDLKAWTDAGTVTSVGGTATFVFDPKTGGKSMFFRAIVQ